MRRGPVGDLLGRISRSLLCCSGACSQVIELALDLRRALQLSEQSRQFCQGRCAGTGTACRPEGRISCSRLFGSDLEFGLGAPPDGDRGDSRHRAIVSRQRLPSLLNEILFRGEIALPDQQALFALLLADESLSGRVLLLCLRLRDIGPGQLLLRLSQVGVHLSGGLWDVGVGLQAKDTEAAITHLVDCADGIGTALDGSPAHRGELILDVLVELCAEHFLQNLGPGARVGVEERRELPLRQHDGRDELLLGQPDVLDDPVADLLGLVADGRLRRRQLDQRDRPLVAHRPLAAPLVPLVARSAPDPVTVGTAGEVKFDIGLLLAITQMRVEPAQIGAAAGHAAVQCEHDGIQDGGFPGSGRTLHEEHPRGSQRSEVDLHPVCERADAHELQTLQFHACSRPRRI